MMRKIAIAALLTLPTLALAEAPKTLTVTKTIEIKAAPAKVWAATKDFDSLNKWHPGFAKDELVKGKNNVRGAVRQLTIKDGPSFTEELLAFNEKAHSYTYRIVESPLPITDYKSTFVVKAGKGGMTTVTWTGSFKRKNVSDTPPEAESDAGVTKLIEGVYDGGLANAKKTLEN